MPGGRALGEGSGLRSRPANQPGRSRRSRSAREVDQQSSRERAAAGVAVAAPGRRPGRVAPARPAAAAVAEVHRPPVVRVGQRPELSFGALIHVGHPGHGQLHQLLRQHVAGRRALGPLTKAAIRAAAAPVPQRRRRRRPAPASYPRPGRSTRCASSPRAGPCAGTRRSRSALIGHAPTSVCHSRYSSPVPAPGRAATRAPRGRATAPPRRAQSCGHSASTASRARTSSERLESCVLSVVIAAGHSGVPQRRRRGRLPGPGAGPVRLAAHLVRGGRQRGPAVERGVLHALGHHRGAGLLECGSGIRRAARPRGPPRPRARSRTTPSVSCRRGRQLAARPPPPPRPPGHRGAAGGSPGTEYARYTPQVRDQRAAPSRRPLGAGRAARARCGRPRRAPGQPSTLGGEHLSEQLAPGRRGHRAKVLARPVKPEYRSPSAARRRAGRSAARRPRAARRSRWCPHTASRRGSCSSPGQDLLDGHGPRAAGGTARSADSRAGRRGRPGGRPAGRRGALRSRSSSSPCVA